MTEPINSNCAIARQIIALLSHYGFDLRGYAPDELAIQWLNTYPEHWVRLAVIEALYQGRYKSVSVEQLLSFWARRQHPIFHFNHEFERLICRKLPRHLTNLSKDPDEDLTLSFWNQHDFRSDVTKEPPQLSSPPVVSKSLEPVETEPPEPSPDFVTKISAVAPTLPKSPVDPTTVETALSEPSSLHQAIKEEEPIHSFTPQPDASGCYRKLKAVAHLSRAGQETA
jgi:hypothetical protein